MKGWPLLLVSTSVGFGVLALEWAVAGATAIVAQVSGTNPTPFDIGNLTGTAALVAIFWWYLSKTVPKREEEAAATIRDLTKTFRDEAASERQVYRESIDKVCQSFAAQTSELADAIRGSR